MIILLLIPFLAGVLGLTVVQVEDAGGYLSRLRFLFLAGAGLGFFGVFWFSWRRGRGPRALIAAVAALLAVRILFPLILILAVIVTGWIDWIATKAGGSLPEWLLHYGLGVFIGAFSVVAALVGAVAATHVKQPKWVITLVVLGAVAVFTFTGPDASALPVTDTPAVGSSSGPTTWEVVRDGERPLRVRARAAMATVFQTVMPRSGWGGTVRNELIKYSRGTPEASLPQRVWILEQALLKARPEGTGKIQRQP